MYWNNRCYLIDIDSVISYEEFNLGKDNERSHRNSIIEYVEYYETFLN